MQRHLLMELRSSALLQGRLRRPGAGPGAGGRGVRPQPDTSRAEPLPGEEAGGGGGDGEIIVKMIISRPSRGRRTKAGGLPSTTSRSSPFPESECGGTQLDIG